MAKVLLVEDNNHILKLYERIFTQHDLVSAKSGEHAFKALERETFDLVILDMHLPVVSGMVVLHYIRSFPLNKDTVVFAISSDDNLRREAQNIGIDYWMTKPIEIKKLIALTNQYV